MRKVAYKEKDGSYSESFDFYVEHKSIKTIKRLHWHDYCEVEFICSGHGEHILNNKVQVIGPGSVFLLTPIDFHRIVLPEGEQMTLYHINFGSSVLSSELMQRITQLREQYADGFAAQVSGSEAESLQADFEQLLQEYKKRSPDGVMMMRACLERLCIRIIRLMSNDGVSTPLPSPINDNSAIMTAIQYVQYNFRSPITLNETARMVQLSTNYFGELFRKQMGVSFGEYLRSRRLECAHRLLADTKLSISEIARESGFRSMSHFSETFRRRYGLTPTEFRRNENVESEE